MAVRMTESMDGVLRDIRHSIRGLRRSPGFALAVLLTLALGIGGNTAIFSVVDQVLLRPLPYPDGDRIVRIYESRLDRPATSTSPTRFSNGVSPANWLDWQQQSRTISSMGIWFDVARTLTGLGEPERLNGQVRLVGVLQGARRRTAARPRGDRGRRQAECSGSRSSQSQPVAPSFQWRLERHRPGGSARRHACHGHWRDAARIPLHLSGHRLLGGLRPRPNAALA